VETVCFEHESSQQLASAQSPKNSEPRPHDPTRDYNGGVSSKITKLAEATLPTRWGNFRICGFEGYYPSTDEEGNVERRKESAVALVMGDITQCAPLVRIHSQCLTGDVFGSIRCDCRQQLELALSMIGDAGCGVLIYEQQEGRGIGLMAKLQAYALQDQGLDTVEANVKLGYKSDCRAYNLPVEIMKTLGLTQIRLLSNNPEKIAAVEGAGIKVVERVSAEVEASEYSERYLRTKQEKMGHLFSTRF